MVVEPAAADSITGSEFNKYIFRSARNSSQDAVAGAAAIAKKGVKIATLAPDYSFGRDGVAAFKEAAENWVQKLFMKNMQIQLQQILLQIFKKLLMQNQIIYLLFGQGQTLLGNKLRI